MDQFDRIPGSCAVKPIIYGNSAERLLQKTPSGHTHKWKIFLKPFCEEDMSKYVKKVQFKLHESYANPARVIEEPPFEVEETGWGEFEVTIKIFFVDPNEKPVTAYYYLRLFQPIVTTQEGRQIVLYEHYDEIVFVEPTKMMMKALKAGSRDKPAKLMTDFFDQKARIVEKLTNAIKEINTEILDLRENLKQTCINTDNKMADSSRATSIDGSVDSGMEH